MRPPEHASLWVLGDYVQNGVIHCERKVNIRAGAGINGRIMLCVQALESAKRFHGIDAGFDLTMLELFEGGNP